MIAKAYHDLYSLLFLTPYTKALNTAATPSTIPDKLGVITTSPISKSIAAPFPIYANRRMRTASFPSTRVSTPCKGNCCTLNLIVISVNSPKRKIGVVLFQLGGPDSLDAIEPFLYNLFSDPDIIDFPFARLARQPLARLISSTRARHVKNHYAEIGGRSPILEFTRRQASALEADLRADLDARVVVAMRYWHPFTAEAIRQLEAHAPEEVVLLPLYPQYSRTTTGSSLNEWKRCFHPNGWNPRVHAVAEFHQDAGYVGALVESIRESLAAFDDPANVDMVFSAHSLPVSVIDKGDPYQRHIERTVELVWNQGRWPGRRHLCYQSKVGASKWLQPSMHATIKTLAGQGSRRVLVIPISFVSDHVETLHEIDIEHRAQALALGIQEYRMVPGLNDAPRFMAVLARLVRAQIATISATAAPE